MNDLTDDELRELDEHLTELEELSLARHELAGAREWDASVTSESA
jgi:hypothetical protein